MGTLEVNQLQNWKLLKRRCSPISSTIIIHIYACITSSVEVTILSIDVRSWRNPLHCRWPARDVVVGAAHVLGGLVQICHLQEAGQLLGQVECRRSACLLLVPAFCQALGQLAQRLHIIILHEQEPHLPILLQAMCMVDADTQCRGCKCTSIHKSEKLVAGLHKIAILQFCGL